MNESYIYNKLRASGLTDAGAAGLMGNMAAESGLDSQNLQNSANARLGMSDAEYTAAVDNGSYSNFANDGAGYGLVQHTSVGRKQGLYNYAKAKGTSIGDVDTQVEYVVSEIQSQPDLWTKLTTTQNVADASNAVLTRYERPANQSGSMKAARASASAQYQGLSGAYATAEATTQYPVVMDTLYMEAQAAVPESVPSVPLTQEVAAIQPEVTEQVQPEIMEQIVPETVTVNDLLSVTPETGTMHDLFAQAEEQIPEVSVPDIVPEVVPDVVPEVVPDVVSEPVPDITPVSDVTPVTLEPVVSSETQEKVEFMDSLGMSEAQQEAVLSQMEPESAVSSDTTEAIAEERAEEAMVELADVMPQDEITDEQAVASELLQV